MRVRSITPSRAARLLLVVVALLSIFSGLTVLIPYVGFVLAALAAFGVGAFASWQAGLAMALVVFVVKQVVDTLIYPIVVGRSIRMHEAIVLIVLVVLSEFGFIWVILAPPVAAVIRDMFLYIYGRFGDPPRPAGLLPGEETAAAVAVPELAPAKTVLLSQASQEEIKRGGAKLPRP
jgi:hypothetical protein